jgi:hypothetical protein
MRQWRKNGVPIDEKDLCDLASNDGETLCELGGWRFRFTARTIRRQTAQPASGHDAAAVFTLRQVEPTSAADPIYLVEFTDGGHLDTAACEARQCGQLADAAEIADRTARRYVCGELFRQARDLIGGDQAA